MHDKRTIRGRPVDQVLIVRITTYNKERPMNDAKYISGIHLPACKKSGRRSRQEKENQDRALSF